MTQEDCTPSLAKRALALFLFGILLGSSGYFVARFHGVPQEKAVAEPEELVLIYKSDVGFNHVVGSSTCPQKAGAISIGTLAKTRSKLTKLEVTGALEPLIKVAPLAPSWEGVRITIMASFTCDVMDKGIYNGTIEATLKELESGREKHVSIPMSGVVQ